MYYIIVLLLLLLYYCIIIRIIITELKGRADLALWFLESHGLKLTCLKVRESDSRREHTFDFLKEKVTQEDQENLEQLLFLLDKF